MLDYQNSKIRRSGEWPSNQSLGGFKLHRLVVSVIILVLIFSFLRSVWLTRQAKKNFAEQALRVEKLRNDISKLEDEVKTATSSFELEKRIREELKLQKPGEIILEVETNN